MTNGLPTPPWRCYGQRAYDAYSAFSGGKSLVTGAELPEWESLSV